MASAVIVAAGKGTRMGPGIDKLFLQVNGWPVVAHTWGAFDSCPQIEQIVLVVRDGMQPAFKEMAGRFGFNKPWRMVPGGKERQNSVWNGLEALGSDEGIVAIQDAARPCTSHALIEATILAARETGAAVAAQPVVDTIKESADGTLVGRTLDRSHLWAVQTPQTFKLSVIRRALSEVRSRALLVTDDTSACELIGQPVRLVVSTEPNPKVTRPEDLAYIRTILQARSSLPPAGQGA